ncbi:MAG TPA: hypothetical protein VLC95_06980 [Anaerolineae bacterium]|nr:hypothetical protein [Anaerolineae bacterium]
MKVRKKSVEFAKSLVRDGKIDMESDWSEAQPSAADENRYLEDHSWDDYANWFLATNEEEGGREDKEYYNFPYGDFEVVHRDGVIAAKQRAGQYDYHDVLEAADELLDMIDQRKGEK